MTLKYAKHRLRAVLAEVHRLQESEFPYSHSQDALWFLKSMFQSYLDRLEALTPNLKEAQPPNLNNIQAVVDRECSLSLFSLYQYLPLLGFILRSTNVRNAFELFHPLLRLAQQLLEPESGTNKKKKRKRKTSDKGAAKYARLILSSEWEYSPLVYNDIPELPGFVLIGFPATESGNGLLAPLAGHELGHSLWSLRKCGHDVKVPLKDCLLAEMMNCQREFKDLSGRQEVTENDLTSDMFLVDIWGPAEKWALRQAEETFCDFVALMIFGSAYLHSFSYLISPSLSVSRSVVYPALKTRVENLVYGASKYGIRVPKGFEESFEDDKPVKLGNLDAFRLELADKSLEGVLDLLSDLAKMNVENSLGSADSQNKENSKEKEEPESGVKKILKRFQLGVPATGSKNFADILNAAWVAFEDDQLWFASEVLKKKDRKSTRLNSSHIPLSRMPSSA